MGLVEEFEVGWGDEGEGNGSDVFELDDDVTVFLDALDDAFYASEIPVCNDDTATYFIGD